MRNMENSIQTINRNESEWYAFFHALPRFALSPFVRRPANDDQDVAERAHFVRSDPVNSFT